MQCNVMVCLFSCCNIVVPISNIWQEFAKVCHVFCHFGDNLPSKLIHRLFLLLWPQFVANCFLPGSFSSLWLRGTFSLKSELFDKDSNRTPINTKDPGWLWMSPLQQVFDAKKKKANWQWRWIGLYLVSILILIGHFVFLSFSFLSFVFLSFCLFVFLAVMMNRIVFSERIQLNWPVGRGLRDSSMPSTRNLFAPLASHFHKTTPTRNHLWNKKQTRRKNVNE